MPLWTQEINPLSSGKTQRQIVYTSWMRLPAISRRGEVMRYPKCKHCGEVDCLTDEAKRWIIKLYEAATGKVLLP